MGRRSRRARAASARGPSRGCVVPASSRAGRYEMEEAIDLFTRAVELCDDDARAGAPLAGDRRWRRRSATTATACGSRCSSRSRGRSTARSAPTPTRPSPSRPRLRSAMWSIRMNTRLIAEWADQATELAAAGSDAHVRAMLARANLGRRRRRTPSSPRRRGSRRPSGASSSARTRSARAASRPTSAGGSTTSATWAERRLELLPEIDDPDHLCEAYESAIPPIAVVGRFGRGAAARRSATRLSRGAFRHTIACTRSRFELELGDACGDWETLVAETGAASDAVRENLETPCVRNPRDLLLCALAHVCLGDEARAVELERDAERIAGQGYETYLSAPRLRMALERGDREAASALARAAAGAGVRVGVGRALAPARRARRASAAYDAIEREAPELAPAGDASSSRSRCGRSASRGATTTCSARPTSASPRSASTGTRARRSGCSPGSD